MTPYELAKAEIGTLEWAQGSNPKVVAYYLIGFVTASSGVQ